jgi:cardiolipin synthase
MSSITTGARRKGLAQALLFCIFACACTAQGLSSRPAPEAPPVVSAQGTLSAQASEALLEAALKEFGDDAGVRALIDDVRRHSSVPLTAGNRTTALIDGPETFASINEAVKAARHHVHVETFIFSDDALGRQFGDLLAQKRKEGVQVRVIYDSIGSMETSARFFDELRHKGIEVRQFRPLNPVKTPLIWKMQNRDHRKIIVVDGKIGFTGGINVSGTYSSSSKTKPGPERGIDEGWRDTHIRIDGPAVAYLQTLFIQMWNRAGEKMPSECDVECFPKLSASGKELVAIVANDSEDDDRSLYATYLAAFSHANSRIWLTHAYFAPNDDMLDALEKAAKRGVDVRLIMPGFSDSSLILRATQSTYARLLRNGVRIYERKDALLHAKSVVIDGVLSVVGSANLDMRSFIHNDEVNAVVVSRDFGRRMEGVFERDQEASRTLDLDTWSERSIWQRMLELGSKFVWYWL